MRVEDLSGALLDYWVFKAEHPQTRWTYADWETQSIPYSVDWRWGGPIIERKRIELIYFGTEGIDGNPWEAQIGCNTHYIDQYPGDAMCGPAPLIAAMRTYVYSVFGEEVPDLDIDAPQVVG